MVDNVKNNRADEMQTDAAVVTPKFPRNLINWFKKRPGESVVNTYDTLFETYHPIMLAIERMSNLLEGMKVIPYVGPALVMLGRVIGSAAKIFDKNASVGEKIFSVGVNVVLITLISLAIAFSAASFGFAFGLTAVSLALALSTVGFVGAIKGWIDAKQSLSDIKTLEALENKPTLNKEEQKKLDAIYKKIGVDTQSERNEKIANVKQAINYISSALESKQANLQTLRTLSSKQNLSPEEQKKLNTIYKTISAASSHLSISTQDQKGITTPQAAKVLMLEKLIAHDKETLVDLNKQLSELSSLTSKTEREAKVEKLTNELKVLKANKTVRNDELLQLEKADTKDLEKIASHKEEIAQYTKDIKDLQKQLSACDTRPQNQAKLTRKINDARTSFFANLTATALAAIVVVTAVALLPLFAPAYAVVVAVAAISIAAAAIGLVFNVMKRYAEQQDKDEKQSKKEGNKEIHRENYRKFMKEAVRSRNVNTVTATTDKAEEGPKLTSFARFLKARKKDTAHSERYALFLEENAVKQSSTATVDPLLLATLIEDFAKTDSTIPHVDPLRAINTDALQGRLEDIVAKKDTTTLAEMHKQYTERNPKLAALLKEQLNEFLDKEKFAKFQKKVAQHSTSSCSKEVTNAEKRKSMPHSNTIITPIKG